MEPTVTPDAKLLGGDLEASEEMPGWGELGLQTAVVGSSLGMSPSFLNFVRTPCPRAKNYYLLDRALSWEH